METVMPRNVAVSVKMCVSSGSAQQFMETQLMKIGIFENISQCFMLTQGYHKTIILDLKKAGWAYPTLYSV